MRTKLFALVCAVASLPVFAADLQAVLFTLDKTTGVTGELVNAVLRVKNAGPDTAPNAAATIGGEGTFFLSATAPAGWTCSWLFSGATCSASLAAGEEAEIRATFLLPPRPDPGLRIIGGVFPPNDPVPANNTLTRPLPVPAAPDAADLTVALAPAAPVITEGSHGSMQLVVRNDGPASTRNVYVKVYAAERHGKPAPFEASGTGWTCTSIETNAAMCAHSSLGAGQSSTIDLRFSAPPLETSISFNARAVAELNHDPNGAAAFASIGIGSASNWHRLLIPVGGLRHLELPWQTDVRMLVRSDVPLDIAPHPCEFISILCYIGQYPLRKQFDAYFNTLLPNDLPESPGAQFLYIRPQDRDKIHINIRVFDQTRRDTTAGTEVPVAHDEDFKNGVISLLNVPFGPGYRQTLRMYDTHETEATVVEIRIFADDETQPHVTQLRSLEDLENTLLTTSARLFTHPRYAQLDFRELGDALQGAELLRIEVEPVTAGSRIWAFATSTNDATHHVTVLSPQ